MTSSNLSASAPTLATAPAADATASVAAANSAALAKPTATGQTPCAIWFLNGPNANLYGLDANNVYGTDSFPVLRERCERKAAALQVNLTFLQSNYEGQLIDWIQEARAEAQGIIINAAGLTYTSIPLLDALLSFPGRIIEVHMSNIWRREPFRHNSFISKAADGVIAGLGGQGYELAVGAMAHLIRPAP